jgi:hypothetical protein
MIKKILIVLMIVFFLAPTAIANESSIGFIRKYYKEKNYVPAIDILRDNVAAEYPLRRHKLFA